VQVYSISVIFIFRTLTNPNLYHNQYKTASRRKYIITWHNRERHSFLFFWFFSAMNDKKSTVHSWPQYEKEQAVFVHLLYFAA
jgi:hypothetical protein